MSPGPPYVGNMHRDLWTTVSFSFLGPGFTSVKELLGPREHLETGALCLRPVDRVVRPAVFVSSETSTQKGCEASVVIRSWLSNDL